MIASGTRLGPYEILGLIGEGGMGQVYRAADTRLDRTVAIKVLPAALAGDPVRRDRFEREARSISRLEHPNICPLYDVGVLPSDAADGSPAGGLFLVMQFLEGETLAQRIERGPLSIRDTLDIGVQIAEALAAAHRAGIVHRDLKPGNVMLTRAGARLLDFGLARTVAASADGVTIAGNERTSLTTQGTLLGTLHYMAPEQLDGREVDTRADVFAFGAVLFEMVTGLKAFEAESPARVMSAILRDDPVRVSTVVPITPAGLDELIHTCLAKHPDERWQGMSDVARQLRWLQSSLSSGRTGPGVVRRDVPAARLRRLVVPMALLLVAAVSAAAARWLWTDSPGQSIRLHAQLLPPDGQYLTGGLALSPDGTRLVFVAADASGARQLWLRPLDSARAQPLAGTTGASDPFWSPDGSEIAFFATNQLKRVPAAGGAVAIVCEAGLGAGGTWGAGGIIVFQPHQQGQLMRVAAGGGRPEPATALDAANQETHHLYPTFLPDGRHFVFYVAGKARGLYVGQSGTPAARTVRGGVESDGAGRAFLFDPDPALPPGAAATPGVYAASGHLLYVRDRVLMARPFDASSRAVAGEAVKVADAVDYNPPGQSAFAAAGSVLVYRPRQHQRVATFTWVDRTGKEVGAIASPPGAFRQLSLGGDGKTAAVERRDAQGVASVWLMDLERGSSTRVPAEYWAGEPLWSFDDRDLSYSIASDSPPNLVVRSDRGAGAERRLTKSADIQYATSWTPDGRTIVFQAFSNDTGWNLFTIPAAGGPEQRLLQTPANETAARLSPDGRWFSYASDESGRAEVYLARFPEADGRIVVSTSGGTRPMWRSDGRELFFIGADGWLMAAGVSGSGAERQVGAPTRLFQSAFFNGLFAPAADGRRFLIATAAASADVVAMELRLNPLQ